jgi:hypothetical protein
MKQNIGKRKKVGRTSRALSGNGIKLMAGVTDTKYLSVSAALAIRLC